MCDRLPRKFDVQTSYKPSNRVLGLIFVVNIKFPRATYHTVPSTEELYCLKSGSTAESHLNAGGDFALVSSLVRFS